MPLVVHHDGFFAARCRARQETECATAARRADRGWSPRRPRSAPSRRADSGRARSECGCTTRPETASIDAVAGLEREREHASFPGRALDDEVSVHQAREVPADGEPQPGAAGADLRSPPDRTRRRSSSRCVGSIPGPVSSTVIVDGVPVPRRRARRGTNGDPSARGELDRVAQQVDDDLADLAGIARQRARQLWIRSNVSSRPLFSVSSRNINCTSFSSARKSNGSTASVAGPPRSSTSRECR